MKHRKSAVTKQVSRPVTAIDKWLTSYVARMSPAERAAYRKRQKELEAMKRQCKWAECSKMFWPKRDEAKYCSGRCKQAAYNERQREKRRAADEALVRQWERGGKRGPHPLMQRIVSTRERRSLGGTIGWNHSRRNPNRLR